MSEWDLVITGSRHGFDGLWRALDALCAKLGRPERVLVREQRGVDQDARAWARARGYVDNETLLLFDVDMNRPSPQRYHEGNERMVNKARPGARCAGFPCPKSRGTWKCLAYAKKRGLQCVVAKDDKLSTW